MATRVKPSIAHVPELHPAVSTVLTAGVAVGAIFVGFLLPAVLGGALGPREMTFLLIAVVVAGIGFVRPSFSIVALVVAFVFSGFLRRFFPAADPTADFASIVPFIVAIPLAVSGLRAQKPVPVVVLLFWLTACAGLAVASPTRTAAGWIAFATPLLVAFGIARIAGGVRTLALTTVACGTIAAVYGILQYFVFLAWDVEWLERGKLISAGKFGTSTFRVFGTLPAPSTAAVLAVVVVLLLLFRRDLLALPVPVRVAALVCSLLTLLLTQVRVSWIALAVCILVGGLVADRRRVLRVATPFLVIGVLLLAVPQLHPVVARLSTLTNLESDLSYRSRVGLLGGAADLTSPVGAGPGALSAGSRAEGSDQSIENGYLVVLGETGLIGLGLLVWVLASMTRRLDRSKYVFLAALLVANFGEFQFGGFGGILLWTFAGLGETPDHGATRVEPDEAVPDRLGTR